MRWLKTLGIGLHYVFNTLLALLLLGFGFLIVVLLRHGEVPVPRSLLNTMDKALAKEGFEIEFDELEIDLRGMAFASNVRLYATGNSDPFFEANQLLIQVSLFRALMGDVVPTQAHLADATFYCPAVISPSGQREPIIERLYVNAERLGKEWNIETFVFQILDARVSINGEFFTPLPGMDQAGPDDHIGENVMEAYIDVCRQLMELQQPLEEIDNLILDIEVGGERHGPLDLSLNVYHDGIQHRELDLSIGAGSAYVRAKLDVDGILRPVGLGLLSFNDLEWANEVKAGYTQSHVQLSSGLHGLTSIPEKSDMYSYDIVAWGMPFDGAYAALDMSHLAESGQLDGQVMLKSGHNWLEVAGPFKPREQSGKLALSAKWNPRFFLQCTAIPEDFIPPNLEIGGRPYWRARTTLLPGFRPVDSEFDLILSDVTYENLKIAGARVKGRIGEDEIDLHSIGLATQDYALTGSYYQQFSTGDYHFNAEGSIWPADLDTVITDDWWQELWADVKFSKTPAEAAIDMRGQYGANGQKNVIYGKATLRDVAYKGEPVEVATARIWQTRDKLDLFDFAVKTPDGLANATLHWSYLPDGNRHYLSWLAQTHVPLVQGATFASDAAIPIAKKFPTKTPPFLDMAGLVYGEHTDRPNELYLKTSARFPGRWEFEDVYFDSGSFLCAVTPEEIKVSEGRMSLGGGQAALHTIVDRQPNGKFYVRSAKISINDADLFGLYKAIPFLRVARAKQEAVERIQEVQHSIKIERSFEERYQGKVKLYFETHGQLPDLGSFVGSGTLDLKDANLGQLHLLGGMSSFLYSIGLHLGTLNFTDAQSDFTLARNNLFFPNGQITGATGEIDINGNFDIANDKLNFLVSLHPFGNLETPIIEQVFTVFSPLADTIEVEVTGTMTTPQYEVSVRPFAFLTGQSKVVDPNADVIKPSIQEAPANDSQ